MVTLEQKIKSRQVQKLSRDNMRPTASVRQRNRRFKKDVKVNKRKKNVKCIDLRKSKVLKKLNKMLSIKTQSISPKVYSPKSKNHY